MIGSTNSFGMAGRDKKIYATNNSNETLAVGDKVMVNFGVTSELSPTDFSFTVEAGRVCPLVFFDDYNFLESHGSNTYFYSYQDLVWKVMYAQGIYGSNMARNQLLRYHSSGVISSVAINKGSTGATGFLVGQNFLQTLPSNYFYLGKYNDVHYCMKTGSNDVYEYNYNTNTVGDLKLSGDGVTENAVLLGNRGLLVNTSGVVEFFEIDNQDDFSITATCALGGSFNLLFATGVTAGHYLFVTNSFAGVYQDNQTPGSNSLLFVYQIGENNTIKKVSIGCLQVFETTNCVINYDDRNQILSVGTKDQVFFYQFNQNDKTIVPLNIALDVPSNNLGFCFWPFISPNKETAVVLHKSDVDNFHVYCYVLGKMKYQIVNNSSINYLPDNSFTGFVTQLANASGEYEVEVCMPDDAQISITTNVAADSVEFLGGGK